MKYNPRGSQCGGDAASISGAASRSRPSDTGQGFLACLYELQEMLKAT